MKSILQVGLIGWGHWGSKVALALQANPNCRLAAICSRTSPETERFSGHVYFTPHSEDVLTDPNIDAVVIATPNETHALFAESALWNNKHVFVEKPMVTDLNSAERLVKLADEKKRMLFVGHILVHTEVFVKLKQILENDELLHVYFSHKKFGTFDSGLIYNLACHHVSTAIELFGCEPDSVEVLHHRGLLTDLDVLHARMKFAGVECISEIDRCANDVVNQAKFVFRKAGVVSWHDNSLFSLSKEGGRELIFKSSEDSLGLEIDAFLTSCRTGIPAVTDGVHGLEVVRTLSRFILPT